MKYTMIELGIPHTVYFEPVNSDKGKIQISERLFKNILEKVKKLGAWDQLADPMVLVGHDQTLHAWIINPLHKFENNKYIFDVAYTIYDSQAGERTGI